MAVGIPPVLVTPVPVRLTVCILPAAPFPLSVTVRVPVNAPVSVGVKLTSIVQLAPAARLDPQLFVWLKLAVIVMLLIVNVALPLFVNVTGCDGLVVFSA